jgi:hypothetical protein
MKPVTLFLGLTSLAKVTELRLNTMVHIYNPSYAEGVGRRSTARAGLEEKAQDPT